MKIIEAKQGSKDLKVAIVISQFNREIIERLEEGCLKTLNDKGVADDNITLVRVPGAFEIPVTVERLLDINEHDVLIALGAVIRGQTPHFDFICNECAGGLMQLSLESGVPVIFGVLTVDTYQQALDRSGDEKGNKGNKGSEAAITALAMVDIIDAISAG